MVVAVRAHRIAYMPVPKAACSSVKAALATIDPDVEIDLEAAAIDNDVAHGIYPTMRFRPHRWKEFEGWWRFTVVRDPLKRLLSVYSDRVQGRQELFNSPKIKRQSEFPPDPDPDFFFQNIEDYKRLASVVKHHALPVRLFIGSKPMKYDRIFTVAQIPELEGELGMICKAPVNVPRINASKEKLDFSTLTGKTQAFLAEFLQEEYDHLKGYFENPFK
jgi:hypothetical protein